MLDWLERIAGPQYVPAVLWTLAALAALVIVLVVVKLLRRASSGTFVAGGRNRKTRLAIMDATAVDSHRRLVLVRRDDVEHLLLIGGANDLVIEQNIRLIQQVRRPADGSAPAGPRPRPAPAEPTGQPQQRQAQTASPVAQPRPAPVTQRPHEPVSQVRPVPRPPVAVAAPAVAPKAAIAAPAPKTDDIDETLLHELEVSLDDAAAKRQEPSLEDEMTRLLGELSGSRK